MDLVAEAKGLIARFIFFPNRYKLLGEELARIVSTRIELVYEVFTQLSESPEKSGIYPRSTTGYFMICKLPDAQLIEMAKNNYGLARLTDLDEWLKEKSYGYERTILFGEFLAPSFQAVRNRIAAAKLAATGSANTDLIITANQSLEPVKLSEAIMDYYRALNQTNHVLWEYRSKTGWKQSGPRVTFDDAICWDLPNSGVGFVVYSPDDLKRNATYFKKLNDDYGYDQIGTKETIDAILKIGREWNAIHPEQPLQIGDISRPGGTNTPDHGTHNNGKIFDMRPLQKNYAPNGLTHSSPNYSSELTKDFIRLAVKIVPGTTVYFNDKGIYGDKEFGKMVSYKGGHDDHLHVMFPGGIE